MWESLSHRPRLNTRLTGMTLAALPEVLRSRPKIWFEVASHEVVDRECENTYAGGFNPAEQGFIGFPRAGRVELKPRGTPERRIHILDAERSSGRHTLR